MVRGRPASSIGDYSLSQASEESPLDKREMGWGGGVLFHKILCPGPCPPC
jgi:hypothetical protein